MHPLLCTSFQGKGGHSTGGSIFSGKIYCCECGQIYGSKVWHTGAPYRKVVWQRNDKFKGEKCSTLTITEEDIKRAFEKLLVKLKEEEVLENLKGIKAGDMTPLRKEKAGLALKVTVYKEGLVFLLTNGEEVKI